MSHLLALGDKQFGYVYSLGVLPRLFFCHAKTRIQKGTLLADSDNTAEALLLLMRNSYYFVYFVLLYPPS